MNGNEYVRRVYANLMEQDDAKGLGLGAVRKGGTIWYVNSMGVLQGVPQGCEQDYPDGAEEMSPVSGIPAGDTMIVLDGQKPSKVSAGIDFSIDRMLERDSVQIPAELLADFDSLYLLPVSKPPRGVPGVWVLRQEQGARVAELVAELPYPATGQLRESKMRTWRLPRCLAGVKVPADMLACIRSYRMRAGILVLLLKGESDAMFTSLAQSDSEGAWTIKDAEGRTFLLDGWNDKDKCYKSLKEKKEKMAKLMNPVNPAKKEEPAQLKTEEQTPEVAQMEDPAAETAQPAAVQPKTEEQTPEVAQTEATQPEAAKTAPQPAAPEEQKSPRKPKPVAQVGFDFTKLMEYLGAQVDLEKTTPEKIEEELRAVRDLQISCARRACNLSIAAIEAYKGDSDRLKEILRMIARK